MTHERAWELLPDLLHARDDRELLVHLRGCQACQRQLFLLTRVDRMRREAASSRRASTERSMFGRRRLPLLASLVAILAVLPFIPRKPIPPAIVLQSADGRAVMRATIGRADEANLDLAVVASGFSTRSGDQFVLWTRVDGGDGPAVVGRFMVDRSGFCRAHFNLPAGERWTRFWVTPASDSSRVVATT